MYIEFKIRAMKHPLDISLMCHNLVNASSVFSVLQGVFYSRVSSETAQGHDPRKCLSENYIFIFWYKCYDFHKLEKILEKPVYLQQSKNTAYVFRIAGVQ
jgi:hypothetical protein